MQSSKSNILKKGDIVKLKKSYIDYLRQKAPEYFCIPGGRYNYRDLAIWLAIDESTKGIVTGYGSEDDDLTKKRKKYTEFVKVVFSTPYGTDFAYFSESHLLVKKKSNNK